MTKNEALRMAIEVFDMYGNKMNSAFADEAYQACKQALAETQEPVYVIASGSDNITVSKDIYNAWTSEKYITTPPSREWVGLSDEEIEEATGMQNQGFGSTYYMVIRAIEAKLREKNNGQTMGFADMGLLAHMERR